MNTHLSETTKEVDDCINQTGLRPVEYLDSINAFSAPAYLAHCVCFQDNALEIVKKRNVNSKKYNFKIYFLETTQYNY